MFLSSDTVYLRALEPADLDFLYTLENDVSVWQAGSTLTPFSKQVLEQYLENAALDIYTIKQLRLVICTSNNEAIGAIDLFDFEPLHLRAGVGIIIAAPFRGKGFAADALNLLLLYCQNILQLHQVYCSVTATNQISIKLFQKAGFSEIGIRRQWLRITDGWEDVKEFQKVFLFIVVDATLYFSSSYCEKSALMYSNSHDVRKDKIEMNATLTKSNLLQPGALFGRILFERSASFILS